MNEFSALSDAFIALLTVLHKNKVIDINDVVSTMGNSIDFGNMQHMTDPAQQRYTMAYYDSLRQIADALTLADEKLKKAQSGDVD